MFILRQSILVLIFIVFLWIFEYFDTQNLSHGASVPLEILIVVFVVGVIFPVIIQEQVLGPLKLAGVLALVVVNVVALFAVTSELDCILFWFKFI